jgi:hypothetical protein
MAPHGSLQLGHHGLVLDIPGARHLSREGHQVVVNRLSDRLTGTGLRLIWSGRVKEVFQINEPLPLATQLGYLVDKGQPLVNDP